jgi:hypothetical protein
MPTIGDLSFTQNFQSKKSIKFNEIKATASDIFGRAVSEKNEPIIASKKVNEKELALLVGSMGLNLIPFPLARFQEYR